MDPYYPSHVRSHGHDRGRRIFPGAHWPGRRPTLHRGHSTCPGPSWRPGPAGSTGKGQHVEAAPSTPILLTLPALEHRGSLSITMARFWQRTGNRHGGLAVAPYNAYRTANGWIAPSCVSTTAIGTISAGSWSGQTLAEEPLLSHPGQGASPRWMRSMRSSGAWTVKRQTAVLVAALNAAGVPCAPVLSLKDVLVDPHLQARGMLEHHENAERDWWTFGSPIHLTDSPSPAENIPAKLGNTVERSLSRSWRCRPPVSRASRRRA